MHSRNRYRKLLIFKHRKRQRTNKKSTKHNNKGATTKNQPCHTINKTMGRVHTEQQTTQPFISRLLPERQISAHHPPQWMRENPNRIFPRPSNHRRNYLTPRLKSRRFQFQIFNRKSSTRQSRLLHHQKQENRSRKRNMVQKPRPRNARLPIQNASLDHQTNHGRHPKSSQQNILTNKLKRLPSGRFCLIYSPRLQNTAQNYPIA